METATDASADELRIDREIDEALRDGVYLDGRRYWRQPPTFERNVYTATAARDTGLVKAMQGFDPLHAEVDERIESLILDGFANGSMYRLLAGVLGEDAVVWTPAVAVECAARFKGLTSPHDQQRLWEIATWVLLDFFLNAGGSWRIFLKYLCASNRTQNDASADATGTGDAGNETSQNDTVSAAAATSTSASGTPSSAPSRAPSIASH